MSGASVNTNSVLAKAKSYMAGQAGQAKVNKVVDKVLLGNVRLQTGKSVHTPEDAASKFIEVLHKSITSVGLSEGAIAAISDIDYTSPHKVGQSTYTINVYFSGDMSRPSLNEAKYGSINDLVALFNNGVDHTMRSVHGVWHGRETWSRTVIPGTQFIEQAVTDFKGNYASEYNVIDISVQGI